MLEKVNNQSYFRFNPPFPEPIPMDAAEPEDIAKLVALTDNFLKRRENFSKFNSCANRFSNTYSQLSPSLTSKLGLGSAAMVKPHATIDENMKANYISKIEILQNEIMELKMQSKNPS